MREMGTFLPPPPPLWLCELLQGEVTPEILLRILGISPDDVPEGAAALRAGRQRRRGERGGGGSDNDGSDDNGSHVRAGNTLQKK